MEPISSEEYDDTVGRLRSLYDAGLPARAHLENAAKMMRAAGYPSLARRCEAVLEALDAALADAQEVLS